VQRWIEVKARGWKPGVHKLKFNTDLDEKPYTVAATVSYRQAAAYSAEVQGCRGKIIPASPWGKIPVFFVCEFIGIEPDYVPQVRQAVSNAINDEASNWADGEQEAHVPIWPRYYLWADLVLHTDAGGFLRTATVRQCRNLAARVYVNWGNHNPLPQGDSDLVKGWVDNQIQTEANEAWAGQPGIKTVLTDWQTDNNPPVQYRTTTVVEYVEASDLSATVQTCGTQLVE
jgi:hypothetical protein